MEIQLTIDVSPRLETALRALVEALERHAQTMALPPLDAEQQAPTLRTRSASAERMRRMRERRKAGLTSTPRELATVVVSAGEGPAAPEVEG